MTVEVIFPFTNPQNYLRNPDDINISGGKVSLALWPNVNQPSTQDFSNPAGFIFDAAKTKFEKLIENTSFGANYNYNIDANFSDGISTGTPTGGANVSGGELDLAYNDVRYVDYDGIDNANKMIQKGTIKFKITPNYTGFPPLTKYLIAITKAANDTTNNILIRHNSDGTLVVDIKDKNNVSITYTSVGLWFPTIATQYEFALCFDLDIGTTRLFITGTQKGSDISTSGERDSNIGLIRVGSDINGTALSNMKIDDLILYDVVLYTGNYTPGYTVPDSNDYEKITQIDQRPANATAYASYNVDEDFSWSNGVATGTLVGGATVENGRLNLKGGTNKYAVYDATDNADSAQQGCIRDEYIPDYTDKPSTTQYLFSVSNGNTLTNLITMLHDTNGQIILTMYNSGSSQIMNVIFGVWSPIQGQKYVLELNWNIDDLGGGQGATRFFIQGTQFGPTQTAIGTRGNPTSLKIGASRNGTSASRHEVDNFIVFNNVQHTTNHSGELPYSYPETIYVSDTITLPTFVYTGPGAVQAFTNFQTTESGSPRYQLNGKYWNGSLWVTSDNSYEQMNDTATVLANLATAPKEPINNIIKMSFPNSNIASSTDELTLTCTTQKYATNNPTIEPATEIKMQALEGLLQEATIQGLDQIKAILKKQNEWIYFDGNNWVTSNEDYSQSNTIAEIVANKESYTDVGVTFKIRGFLHSEDGSTTPLLDKWTILFDFYGGDVEAPNVCVVYGTCFDELTLPESDITITFELDKDTAIYDGESQIFPDQIVTQPDLNGYWEAELIITANMNAKWIVTFEFQGGKTKQYSIVVPNQVSADFAGLVT